MSDDSVAQDMIRSFVDRILRLKEEVADLNRDIREVYAEAKGNGFDKTALGQLVTYVGKRQSGANELAEREALFDLYLAAYDGSPSRTHAYARQEPQPQAAQSHEIHDSPSNRDVSADGEASPLAGPQAEAGPSREQVAGTFAGHEGRSKGEAASVVLPTNSPEVASEARQGAPEPEAVVGKPEAASGFTPKQTLRQQLCQHTDKCASMDWKQPCYSCRKAAGVEERAA